MPPQHSAAAQSPPRIVIPEPCYWHLDAVAHWLGDDDAAAVLREADGIEAALQMHVLALGDPKPRGGPIERFHAWCDRHRVRLVRTFHAVQSANPVARRLHWSPGDPRRVDESIRLVRAQVSCAAAMRRPPGGESLLVIHPGYLYRDDVDVTVDSIVRMLRGAAEHAAALGVRVTVETEPVTRWGLRVGSELGRLARIVEAVNSWCDRRGLPSVAAVTIDLEHTLIANWGRHHAVHDEIDRYGRLIEHVHIVRPLDLFHVLSPQDPFPWHRRPSRLMRMILDAGCPGAHATIAPPGGDPRFEALIREALHKTNWRRIGVFNLEVMPPWFYPTSMLTRGSRPHEMLASLRLLRKLVGSDGPAA